MINVSRCDDVPPAGIIEIELLSVLKNDVVVLLLGSKIKVMCNKGKGFSLQELDWLRHYVHKKIKTLDIKSSVSSKLVVVDIVGDLRELMNRIK